KPDDEALKCYFCGEVGHVAMMCEALAKINCSKCGKPGHTRKFCHKAAELGAVCLISKHPEMPKRSGAESWRKPKSIEMTTVSDHSVRCKVEVGKKEGVAVVDTGSLKTFLPEEMVEMDAPMTSFTMADGVSKLWTRGPIEMEFTVAGVTFVHPIYLREAKEAIIGSDLL